MIVFKAQENLLSGGLPIDHAFPIESEVRMATQPERIASLETHSNWHWTALAAVAAVGLAWLSWVSLTLISVKGDVQAVR